jgi:hypothetical protein
MTLNLPLIRRYVHRLRAGRSVAMESLATRAWTIHPERKALVPKAIHLDGMVERIISLSPYRRWESERPLIAGGSMLLAPTRAYLCENVEVAGPCIYAGAAAEHIGYGSETMLRPDATERRLIDEAHLVTTFSGANWFGTYFLDDLPLELLSPSAGQIALQRRAYGHEWGYRELMALPAPPIVRDGRIRRLTMYEEPAQNASKAARYQELRGRLRRRVAGSADAAARLVYLRRGSDGERRVLENEPAVEQALERLGFVVVDSTGMTAEEIARRTYDAEVVVSVEGSHLTHSMYTMADDAAYLVIMPPERFALQYKDFTDAVGMRFGFTVAQKSGDGFVQDLDDLRRTLDLLM